ncbi:GAF and ANTAR domain-containing protein [Streptomyces fumanus]|uniref:GAF domain-containing protein n=1 Tax=Streptomyces fumanus TaxID=67302 RepID=A0A919AFL0_9ACTN|nr:GAF and ANTAR domain-containing protein [Streptomyces fumanus]GHF03988.1 GAF domain-containing protein [Streptomyces fumanus]
MTGHRVETVLLASRHADHPAPARSITRACREALDAPYSVGLTLAADAALAQRASLAADGPLAERGEALQINLGEGPCIQALRRHAPVFATDLDDPEVTRSWPVFAAQARAHGIRSVFTVPVVNGPGTAGQTGLVLSLYGDRPGRLSDADLETARAHAHAAELLLLSTLTPEEDEAAWGLLLPVDAVIHQATGMISYRHGLSTDQAVALLRAHAHLCDVDLTDLSFSVVHHGLRLPELAGPPSPENSGP